MADSNEPGFSVNAKTLGFVLSLFAIGGLAFTMLSSVTSYSYRIERIEEDNKTLASDIAKVSDKLAILNDQLVSLTITLNKVEARLDAKLERK